MGSIFIYLFYFIFVIFLNYYEYKRFNTFLNPFSILSIPFTVIVLLCIAINPYFEFVLLVGTTLIPWIWGLLIFWLAGRFVALTHVKVTPFSEGEGMNKSIKVNYIILAFMILVCLFFIVKFKSISATQELGSKDFGGELMIGGLAGRFSNFLLIFIPYLFFVKINKVLKVVLLALFFLFVVSYASKTWLVGIFIVSIIVNSLSKKSSVKIKGLLFTVLGGLSLFVIYYAFLIDPDVLFDFIFRHFYFYLTSGVLGLNGYVLAGSPDVVNNDYLVLPFVNALRTFQGLEPFLAHSPLWYVTDLRIGTETNVYTFFGTIGMFGDPIFFVIYTFILGFISYFMFYFALKKNNIFLYIMYGYNLLILFYGWYNCGYNLLRYWEIFVYCIFLFFINNINLGWSGNKKN